MPGLLERLAPYVGLAIGLSEEAVLRAYRPALQSDIPQILVLRRQVNGEMWWDDRAFVEWRYFSRKTETGQAPYWVFVRGGEVIGACGLEPVTLVIDRTAVSGVRTLDIMVRPDLDGLGLGAFMNLVLFEHFPITLVTGSNARSHTLLARMFHHATDLRFWKIPIQARAMIDAGSNPGSVSTLVARMGDPLLALWRARRRVEAISGISIREMASFDSRVVELSRRCEVAGRLIVRRTDELLNWRFVQNPRCRHRLIGAFRGDRLEGYLITRLNRDRPNPRSEAEIVDWLAASEESGAGSVLPALIQAGVDMMIREGAGIVSCAASGDMTAAMTATGFRFRPAERIPFFVKAADPVVNERLSSGRGWYLTRGDHDVE